MQLKSSDRWEVAILAVACVLPTVVTLAYFVWAAGSASTVQQSVYGVAKLVQFSLPVVWVGLVSRGELALPRPNLRGLGWGVAFGTLVLLATWLLYAMLSGTSVLENALEPIRDKIAALGLATPVKFVAVGAFYAVVHSLLEEYYWRWFVFGRLRRHVSRSLAIGISSVAFAAHHVVVLWAYFAHAPWMALLLAAGVAVGGAFWAWLYDRSQSIYAPWASHLLVDAAIFAVGYQVAEPLFASVR